MKRRNVLLGIGTAAVGTTALVGTGAFSRSEASRSVSVEVADDNDAYLGLRQLGSGQRALEDGTPETVEFSFPSAREDDDLGLGTNSVYEFTQDADEANREDPVKGLLEITNAGTHAVEVRSEQPETDGPGVELFDIEDSNRVALRESPRTLEVGKSFRVGFRIDTRNLEAGEEFDEKITIVAEAVE